MLRFFIVYTVFTAEKTLNCSLLRVKVLVISYGLWWHCMTVTKQILIYTVVSFLSFC